MKRGSVDWTVGKLLAIVLAVVLLVIVVFGWSSLIWPLIERGEGKINEVLLLFSRWGGDGGDVECIEERVVDVDGGRELKKELGFGGDLKICLEYCELGLKEEVFSEFVGASSRRFKYDFGTGVMSDRGLVDDRWYVLNQDYLGLDIEKVNIVRDVYERYKGAYDEYFNNHKKSKFNINLKKRFEIAIYVKVGNKLYRWLEDIKSWEVCDREIDGVKIKEYCSWSEKGRWYARAGEDWNLVEDFGKGFDYFDEIIKDWDSGEVFWYSVDYVNLINEENPTLELMQEVRNKEIREYKNGLKEEFMELLNYDFQDDEFSVYVDDVTSLNSPIVSIEDKKGDAVEIKKSIYLNDDINVVSEEGEGFVNVVKKVSSDEFNNVIKINKVYEFLEKEC